MSFTPRSPEDLVANWPAELDHVSASSLKQFARCPEQWRRVRMQGERQRPAGAVIQGKADHHAIGQHFRAQVEHDGVGLALPDVQDAFTTRFEEEITDEGITEISWGKDITATDPASARRQASKVKDAGVKLVSLYHQDVGPYFKATEVEHAFTVSPENLPVKVEGYIDAVGVYVSPLTQEADAGPPVIIERKTSARVGMPNETELQARLYQIAAPLDVDVHVSVKRGFIQWGAPELRVPYTPERVAWTLHLAAMAIRQIAFYYTQYGPDQPWPGAITHPWACNYCGFRDSCAWWSA